MNHTKRPNTAITLPIDEGFDRQNLRLIRKRFESINLARLKRMRDALAERHQHFLDVLPILFHCNHPLLPGFVNRKTPSKITQYKPSLKEVDAAKIFGRSFALNYEPNIPESITSIFVMGSVGTVAQSERSDLDIWLCFSDELSKEELILLKQKSDRITQWTDKQNLEVHFFLMNESAFKNGKLSPLDKESSGSAQRQLLLDEFYRSSIFIAGRIPLWWSVPVKEEPNYKAHTHTLLERRFIYPHQVIDFGGIANIPGGEFVGAGIWQLYKSIESPYKSVLKLLLLEAYVASYPHITPLALEYKQLVFDGETDIDKLDSYLMIYRRIERYLTENDQVQRLALAQRCFYIKINRALSRSSPRAKRPWQRNILLELTREWGWDQATLSKLDTRKNWKIQDVAFERTALVTELNHSYKFLRNFAQEQQLSRAISTEELTILGRKLQAAFERRPGKIDWINPNISSNLAEEHLYIIQSPANQKLQQTWHAFTKRKPNLAQDKPIRSTSSFVELLIWCIYNGILDTHSHLDLSHAPDISLAESKKIIGAIQQHVPQANAKISDTVFNRPARPVSIVLLLNIGRADSILSPPSPTQPSKRLSDALLKNTRAEVQVYTIDIVTINSWHEIQTRRLEGRKVLIDVLKELLQQRLPNSNQGETELNIHCIGGQYAKNIEIKTKQWLSEILDAVYRPNKAPKRYIFELMQDVHYLEFQGPRPIIHSFSDEQSLLLTLGSAQKSFRAIGIDSLSLKDSILPIITQKMRRNTVSIFYRRFDIGMEIYLADERGTILRFSVADSKHSMPLIHLHHFLRAVIQRLAQSQPELLSDFGVCPVYFYEVQKTPQQSVSITQTPISQNLQQNALFEVSAKAYCDDEQHVYFNFYCGDEEFSFAQLQDELYKHVAHSIFSKRKSREPYRAYLSDLDLSACAHQIDANHTLQISHFLRVKIRLEEKLNLALIALRNH